MTANITTLALNLLISERISQRSLFATKISELLEGIKCNSDKERQIMSDFLSVIDQCVENPTGEFRDVFYHYAVYYSPKVLRSDSNLSSAA